MQIKLTQDYYGFIRQSIPLDRQAAPEQVPPQTPPRQKVLPAERLVEGELLKNRRKPTSPLEELLQRGRFAHDPNAQDATTQTARRAIDAYRGYASASGSGSRGVDYYV